MIFYFFSPRDMTPLYCDPVILNMAYMALFCVCLIIYHLMFRNNDLSKEEGPLKYNSGGPRYVSYVRHIAKFK